MAKITAPENCGNAPKQQYILDLLTKLADMNVEAALDMLTDDARLEIVGRSSYTGKTAINTIITEDGSRSEVTTLDIANIISHGKYCAAHGVMQFADGGEVAFNNMYTFSSNSKKAKLELIETYSVVLD